jgi:hypothetical protein
MKNKMDENQGFVEDWRSLVKKHFMFLCWELIPMNFIQCLGQVRNEMNTNDYIGGKSAPW